MKKEEDTGLLLSTLNKDISPYYSKLIQLKKMLLIQDNNSTRLLFTIVRMEYCTKFVPHNNKKNNVVLECVLWIRLLQLQI
jgi:hypothetical protein